MTEHAINPIDEAEYENLPWLHVYPQYAYHSELKIIGNAVALLHLADALRAAAETGAGKSSGITSDGEGFPIEILRTNTTGLRYTSLPYTAEWARDLNTNPTEQ